jgi:hypothetical protein
LPNQMSNEVVFFVTYGLGYPSSIFIFHYNYVVTCSFLLTNGPVKNYTSYDLINCQQFFPQEQPVSCIPDCAINSVANYAIISETCGFNSSNEYTYLNYSSTIPILLLTESGWLMNVNYTQVGKPLTIIKFPDPNQDFVDYINLVLNLTEGCYYNTTLPYYSGQNLTISWFFNGSHLMGSGESQNYEYQIEYTNRGQYLGDLNLDYVNIDTSMGEPFQCNESCYTTNYYCQTKYVANPTPIPVLSTPTPTPSNPAMTPTPSPYWSPQPTPPPEITNSTSNQPTNLTTPMNGTSTSTACVREPFLRSMACITCLIVGVICMIF